MSDALVAFSDASIGYGHKLIAEHLQFSIASGDFLGLVGPNGTGKTTLLRTIVGALRPLNGSVTYPSSAAGLKPRFGYMPQHQNVDSYYPLTVTDIVMMGRYPLMGRRIFPNKEDKASAIHCLEVVGMVAQAKQNFGALSGGQQQRVLMARAICGDPDILLLDEPTNGMDISATYDILKLIDKLHASGQTVVLVTHQLDIVAKHTSRVGILHARAHDHSQHSSHTTACLTIDDTANIITSAQLSRLYGRNVVCDPDTLRITIDEPASPSAKEAK